MAKDHLTCAKIDRIIKQWLLGGRMFTAFEVSLEIKSQGSRERHRNMRESIHEALNRLTSQFDYDRTLMDVGAPTQAFVYHHKQDNPQIYVPLDRSNL